MPIALYNVSSDVLKRYGHFNVAHGENSAQGTMLAPSRWAKQALGIPCPAAFWDGEMSETAPDVYDLGIYTLGPDLVDLWNEDGVGAEPGMAYMFLLADFSATKRGHAAGYWNGERVLKDVNGKTGYNFDVVGIKRGVGDVVWIYENELKDFAPPDYPNAEEEFPDGIFRAANRWARSAFTGDKNYNAAIPLFLRSWDSNLKMFQHKVFCFF
jgi:hypothetical protein